MLHQCYEENNKKGGEAVYGWCIWQSASNFFITAEFHAIWKNKSGGLIDITKKPDGETKILFVLDGNYKGFDAQKAGGLPKNRLFNVYNGTSETVRQKIDEFIRASYKKHSFVTYTLTSRFVEKSNEAAYKKAEENERCLLLELSKLM